MDNIRETLRATVRIVSRVQEVVQSSPELAKSAREIIERAMNMPIQLSEFQCMSSSVQPAMMGLATIVRKMLADVMDNRSADDQHRQDQLIARNFSGAGFEYTPDDAVKFTRELPGKIVDYSTGGSTQKLFGDNTEITLAEGLRNTNSHHDKTILLEIALQKSMKTLQNPIQYPEALTSEFGFPELNRAFVSCMVAKIRDGSQMESD